jgi:hypothetical protein
VKLKEENMELFRVVIVCVLLIGIQGCAALNTPSASLIDTVPVVTIGSAGKLPEGHIIYVPADREFPVEFSVKGDVFTETVSSIVMVRLKQDLYLYKYWSSLDGKTWVNSHKLLNVEQSGGFGVAGGKAEVKLDFVD